MRSIKLSLDKHVYFTKELYRYAKYVIVYPPLPPPTPPQREPAVQCFTLLGMGMHSIKLTLYKHAYIGSDWPRANRTYYNCIGMDSMQSTRRWHWYVKYALIHTGMYWYAQYINVAS